MTYLNTDVISHINIANLESFMSYGIATLALIATLLGIALVSAQIKHLMQSINGFTVEEEQEEVIECVGLESISAEEYLDMEELDMVQVETTPIFEIEDNVVYLNAAYTPEEDVIVMESEGITLKENVEMAVWTVRRGFRAAVKFVKDLAAAPARIAELEKQVKELQQQNFDFDFYQDDEDTEVIDFVNRA